MTLTFTDDPILLPLNSPPRDVIKEVTTPVNHVADLCICLHSRLQHHSILGAPTGPPPEYLAYSSMQAGVTEGSSLKRSDRPCRCERFNPVAPRSSSHAYRRGQKATRRRLADLVPGDRVLAGWTTNAGKLRLVDTKAGALVVTVDGRRNVLPDSAASGQTWFERAVIVTTDLGETVPQPGGAYVWTVGK